jgi:hypothetical protein
MVARRDLFGECNVGGHPVEAFTTECCANCINPECTRSLSGKAKFDHRTASWFDHYFGDKDRMDPSDARFPKIAGQKFLLIDPGLTGRAPEVGSAWIDPRDLSRQEAPPAPSIVLPTAVAPPPAIPPIQAPERAQAGAAPAPRGRLPQNLLLANAPAQGNKMVPAPPSANIAPAQPKDPWAGPVPEAKDEAPVISPGARVKMGGGGV